MKALLLNAEARTASTSDVTKPIPSDDELLIKVEAVALNPVDSLYVFNPLGATGRTVGSDFAGTISVIGINVSSSRGFRVGDRVAGFVQGACSVNERPGAFAEYVVSPSDLVWKVPNAMSLEAASTVSLCGLTAAQAIWYRLGMMAPFQWGLDEPRSAADQHAGPICVFIYGASTSVALYAAQLVQLTKQKTGGNIVLIGAAGKKHYDTLKAAPYAFDHLVDYRDDDWVDQVYALTKSQGLHYAYDCISEGATVEKIHNILHPTGKLAIVRSAEGGAWTTSKALKIEPSYGAVWEGLGAEVQYQGMNLQANAEARAFAVAFYRWLSETGGLQPNRVRLMPGGLYKIVPDGFHLLGSGSMGDRKENKKESWMAPVSAEKLVYRIFGDP